MQERNVWAMTHGATESLCVRVFCHEQMFGMRGPENPCKAFYVLAKLPSELQACIKELTEDR